MKFFILMILSFASAAWAEPEFAKNPFCQKENPQAPHLYSSDFSWDMSLADIHNAFQRVYSDSGKRLPSRIYWNAQKKSLTAPFSEFQGGEIEIPEVFVQSIQDHIRKAYQADYVDVVMFPDMGHSHFLIPQASWDQKYNLYPVAEFAKMLTELMKDPQLKVLYHTAEQLKMANEDGSPIQDPRVQWRIKTRNLVGSNSTTEPVQLLQNPKSEKNTAEGAAGYYWWGGGFNISANKAGCFAVEVNGKTLRFDLSFQDLVPR